MTRRFFIIAIAFLFLPLAAHAETSPILNCNAGQYGGSPGTTVALQSVFVPVNDAAVTLNTGVLIYKECILRGIAAKQRALMTASVAQQGIVSFQTGRQEVDPDTGEVVQKPLYPENLNRDLSNEGIRTVGAMVQNGDLNGIDPSFRAQVQRAALRQYVASVRQPYADLNCPYAMSSNSLSIWDRLQAYQNPACSPYGAYLLTQEHIQNNVANAQNNMILKLNWGNGIYDVSTIDQNGNRITQTPGIFVQQNTSQLLQSGFAQTQAANDINQMVSALFTGMTAQILNANGGGLAGLIKSTGNQPSYLAQVVAGAQQEAGSAAANAGIAIVQGMRATEQAYFDVMRAIYNLLSGQSSSFTSTEAKCWTNIISKTCDGVIKADGTCTSIAPGCTTDATSGQQTCPTGFPLKVATSTAYSAIALQLLPGGSNLPTVRQNIQTSSTTLAFFDGLIANLSSGNPSAQQQALNQLSAIMQSARVHTQGDVTTAQTAQNDLQQQISVYSKATTDSWAGTDSNGTAGAISWNGNYPPKSTADVNGWCNYNDSKTIQRWIAKWKK